MNTERLNTLCTLLREVAADADKRRAFSLDAWVGRELGYENEEWKVEFVGQEFCSADLEDLPDHSVEIRDDGCVVVDVAYTCGFAACAIGWAGSDLRFTSQGFCIDRDLVPVYHSPTENLHGWTAVCWFFDIGRSTAHQMFSPEKYAVAERVDPLAVAARIEELVIAG